MNRMWNVQRQPTYYFLVGYVLVLFGVVNQQRSFWFVTSFQLPQPNESYLYRSATTATTKRRLPFDHTNNIKYYYNQHNDRIRLSKYRDDSVYPVGMLYSTTPQNESSNIFRSKLRFPYSLKFLQSIQSVVSRLTNLMRGCNRKLHKAMVAMIFVATMLSSSIAMARSGGRIGGGSFKSSAGIRSGPSMSRPYSGSSGGGGSIRFKTTTTTRPRQYPGRTVMVPRILQHQYYSPTPNVVIQQFSRPNSGRHTATAYPPKDVLFLLGTGALISYGLANNAYRRNNDNYDDEDVSYGPTAKGATLASVTVALDVAKKNDPDSILSRLRRIADSANTVTNRGLQDLVTAVTIELTRQESSISSATAKAEYYRSTGQAEREFQIMSVKERSKVDRLTVNKFNSQDNPDDRAQNRNSDAASAPTKAVVTLNVALGGNFVGKRPLSKVSSRSQLIDLLTQIGSDVQLEDNTILSAEIFWSPEDLTEELTQQELYSKYPELLPL